MFLKFGSGSIQSAMLTDLSLPFLSNEDVGALNSMVPACLYRLTRIINEFAVKKTKNKLSDWFKNV